MAVERMRKGLCTLGAVVICTAVTMAQDVSSGLSFRANDKGEYAFDTGVLRGTLRAAGKSQGPSGVVHVPTAARLDRGLGLISHYRVFTTNTRYGTAAWDWPSTAALLPDGAVRVVWPAAADRPFEMSALYRWKDPQTIDVETSVTAHRDLSGFESFLASYMDAAFPSPFVYVGEDPDAQGKPPFFLAGKAHGLWQMFPRDAESLLLIRDGRWTLEPNPVDWTIMPHLAGPICLRRSSTNDLTVVLMSPPQDCFAIATPHEGEGHYSLYLSLFGRDLKAGQTAKARARLVIAANVSDQEVVSLYRQYIKGL